MLVERGSSTANSACLPARPSVLCVLCVVCARVEERTGPPSSRSSDRPSVVLGCWLRYARLVQNYTIAASPWSHFPFRAASPARLRKSQGRGELAASGSSLFAKKQDMYVHEVQKTEADKRSESAKKPNHTSPKPLFKNLFFSPRHDAHMYANPGRGGQ